MATRLIEGMGENSPQEYDRIYFERKSKAVDSQDMRRWKKLLKHYRGGKLIDLGCLDSLVPLIAKKWYPDAEIWGIDTAKEAIEDMKKQYPFALFETSDVYNTALPSHYFDYAVAGELIEHLDDPKRFLEETFRILKHGGILAISTPLEEEKEVGAIDGHRHLWSYSENDLQELLGGYGKVWTRTMGSEYFPIYKYHWPSLLAFCKKN